MYVPGHYAEPSGSWTADLVRDNPLALAVTNGEAESGPFATHLPVIPDPAFGETLEDLKPGTVLLGHMNRANPHWKSLSNGDVMLLTFSGPHAYVSPTLYATTPAAPTWNFTSVHVRGTVQTLEAGEQTLEVVRATARIFEARFGAGWDQTESVDYFRQIVGGVGAFRFTVTGAEGMFKLSQEQPAEARARVRESFAAHECSRRRAVAELMDQLPDNQKG